MNFNHQHAQKLSIGMPVFNGELFIEKAIKSILAQTFTNFELIISDNGSTDSTKKICGEFLTKDKRIKFFSHEKNLGANWNFNFIINNSLSDKRGKVILINNFCKLNA